MFNHDLDWRTRYAFRVAAILMIWLCALCFVAGFVAGWMAH